MLDNIPVQNKARDKAWEAFIKRKGAKDMFPQEFKFPLDRGYYEMWCQCWSKAWDAGFKEAYFEAMQWKKENHPEDIEDLKPGGTD